MKTICLVLITADRGLAGGLNSAIINHAWRHIQQWEDEGKQVSVVTVGRKGRDWMARFGVPMRATFINVGDRPTSEFLEGAKQATGADINSVSPIARVVIDDFANGDCDAVYLAYTDFVNVLRQTPTVRQILPIHPGDPTAPMAPDYIFEPDAQTVLSMVLYNFTELQILQSLYEVDRQRARCPHGGHAQRHGRSQRPDLRSHAQLQQGAAREDHQRTARYRRRRQCFGVAAWSVSGKQ